MADPDRLSLEELRSSGQRIGPFELRELLGRGGMGEVWLARDTMLHRDVAIKVLAPDCQLGAEAEARLVREARAASALDHEGIVRVHQLGHANEQLFIAMEYVPGRTLAEVVSEAGALSPKLAADLVAQVASALQAAHDAGIVHRDIKPDNVVLRDDGRIKVLDFGLVHAAARAPDSVIPSARAPQTSVVIERAESTDSAPPEAYDTQWVLGCTMAADGTQTQVAGTPLYMAPEQIEGRDPTPRADQFALAACAFELLTGRPLRHGATVQEVLDCSVEEVLRRAASNLPSGALAVLERALQRDPRARYESVTAFATALRKSISPLSLPPRLRAPARRQLYLPLALLVVVLSGALVWLGMPRGPEQMTLAIVPGNRVLFAQLYAPLGSYLGDRLDMPVRIVVPPSYDATIDGLVRGDYQLAFLAPNAYVEARRRLPELVLLGGRSYRTDVPYRALVVVRPDGAKTLAELAGKRLCLVDPRSTSGYLVPRRMLADAGVDPRAEMPTPLLSGDHFKVLRDLRSGKCEAGAVSSMELADAPRQGMTLSEFRVIAESKVLPPAALVARPDVPPALRGAVARAMAEAEREQILLDSDLSEHMGTFVHVSDADYDMVRELD